MSNPELPKSSGNNSCYSRRLEEVFTEDYPQGIEPEQNIKPSSKEPQTKESLELVESNSNESERSRELGKVKPKIQDCGLNSAKSEQAEEVAPSECSE